MADEHLNLIIGAIDKNASKILKDIQKNVMAVGAAYLSFTSIKGLFSDIMQEGMAAEKVWNQVNASLKRHGYEAAINTEIIKDLGIQMMKTAGITDEEYGTAVQRLIDHNVKLADTHKVIQAATDLSVAKGIDFTTAIELLGKANEGVTATLTRYGIVIDDTVPKGQELAAVLGLLNERFGGAAAAAMDTNAAKVKLLGDQWGELKEKIYDFTSPGLSVGLGIINDALDGMTNHTGEFLKNLEISMPIFAPFIDLFANSALETEKWDNKVKDLVKSLNDINAEREKMEEGKAFIKNLEEQSAAFQASLDEQLRIKAENNREANAEYLADNLDTEAAITAGWNAQNALRMQLQLEGLIEKERIDAMFAKSDQEYFNTFMRSVREKKDVAVKVETDIMTAGRAAHNALSQSMNNTADRMVAFLFEAEGSLAEIWKGMYKDFVKYFAQAVLQFLAADLVTGMLHILGHIFDNPVNDRIAMTQGEHYAGFFMKGLTGALGSANVAGKLSAVNRPGGNVYIEMNQGGGSMPSIQSARDLLPLIEQLILNGESRISIGTKGMTGGPDVSFA